MFLLDEQEKFVMIYTVLWILLAILFVVSVVFFILRLVRIHKKGKKALEEDALVVQDELFTFLGGNANILNVSKEMSRITVEVVDIEAVNGDGLKTLGATGVLLVGNKVKLSFSDNADGIYDVIKSQIKEDN